MFYLGAVHVGVFQSRLNSNQRQRQPTPKRGDTAGISSDPAQSNMTIARVDLPRESTLCAHRRTTPDDHTGTSRGGREQGSLPSPQLQVKVQIKLQIEVLGSGAHRRAFPTSAPTRISMMDIHQTLLLGTAQLLEHIDNRGQRASTISGTHQVPPDQARFTPLH